MEDKSVFSKEQQDAVQTQVMQLMKNGMPAGQIKRNLIEQGIDQESASAIDENSARMRPETPREAAGRDMLHGALWCIGGILVTALTYQAAEGGGTYIIAWGAIVFGAIQFFKGLFHLSS